MSSKKPKLDTMKKEESPKLATVGSTSAKETIYVDVDDEITAIIEKVKVAKGKIIALVLPKRAVVLQSVVNMKLLKRTAADAGKHIVLVTTEVGLLPLAGLVGLHVADTPTSKPVIPPIPERPSDEPESVDEPLQIHNGTTNTEDFDKDKAGDVPIGALAGVAAVKALDGDDSDEEVVMGNELSESGRSNVTPVARNKKLSIPNFDKFRLRLVLGAVFVALLIAGWVVATKILPSSSVAIQTNSEVITSALNLTLDTAATSVDAQNKIIPATAQAAPKTYTQSMPATGQKNNGTKASGSVVLKSSVCSLPAHKPDEIPVGSSVKANNHTYITQDKASFSSPQLSSDGKCFVYTSNSVSIVALRGGAEYNTDSSTDFTGPNGTAGTGSAEGGTDDIIKVVAQSDIDSAKAKIATQDTTQVKQDLQNGLKAKGLMPVVGTFVAGEQQVKTSANPGDEAESVTVTSTVTYTMLGIKKTDLQQLITANVDSQIDKDKQKILDDGITTAQFTVRDATATSAVVGVKVKSVAGPDIDITALKKQIAGKKSGEITSSIGGLPGVTKVQVTYSPFWVTTAPTNIDKITVTVAKPTGTQ